MAASGQRRAAVCLAASHVNLVGEFVDHQVHALCRLCGRVGDVFPVQRDRSAVHGFASQRLRVVVHHASRVHPFAPGQHGAGQVGGEARIDLGERAQLGAQAARIVEREIETAVLLAQRIPLALGLNHAFGQSRFALLRIAQLHIQCFKLRLKQDAALLQITTLSVNFSHIRSQLFAACLRFIHLPRQSLQAQLKRVTGRLLAEVSRPPPRP